MAVLDLITGADEPLRFSDILALSGEPRGTLHRHLKYLVDEGLAEIGADGRYCAGLRLLTLASRAWSQNDIRRIARPHLEALQQSTGETVHLGILKGTGIVYLDKVEGQQAIRMHSQIGNVSPVYCTGIGKAALSILPPAEMKALISLLEFKRYTENTIYNTADLVDALAEVKNKGYALDMEEHEPGIRCIAMALPFKGQLGGVSITAPVFRTDQEQLVAWHGVLGKAVSGIVADLDVRLDPVAPH